MDKGQGSIIYGEMFQIANLSRDHSIPAGLNRLRLNKHCHFIKLNHQKYSHYLSGE